MACNLKVSSTVPLHLVQKFLRARAKAASVITEYAFHNRDQHFTLESLHRPDRPQKRINHNESAPREPETAVCCLRVAAPRPAIVSAYLQNKLCDTCSLQMPVIQA